MNMPSDDVRTRRRFDLEFVQFHPSAISDAEQLEVGNVASTVHALSTTAQRFADALALFDACQRQFAYARAERDSTSKPGDFKRVAAWDAFKAAKDFAGSWEQIATREAAMAVYEFLNCLKRCRTQLTCTRLDPKGEIDGALSRAISAYNATFGAENAARVRGAAAHGADTSIGSEEHSVSGPADIGGYKLEASAKSVSIYGLTGPKLVVTRHHGIHELNLMSEETLEALLLLREMVLEQVRPIADDLQRRGIEAWKKRNSPPDTDAQ